MFPSWWSPEDILVVINIGIDESKSGSLLVLSAIVGKTRPMEKLNNEWSAELSRSGIDYFHAKDHWNLKAKAYHGISMRERQTLLDRLILHLQHRFMFGTSTIIDESEHRQSTSERFRSQYGSPYGWAFQMLMMSILVKLTTDGKSTQPVNILIEEGHPNCGQAMGFIEHKKKLNSNKGLRVKTYGKGGKKDNPILQAADMLAFGVNEYHSKGESVFASRLASKKGKNRFFELKSDQSSIEAVTSDIRGNQERLKAGVPGSKRRTELVMW
jgi:hypothetical protein